MSSWINSSKTKKLPYDALYCKTSTSGYCSNFFNFFHCYLYARYKKQTLYLKDTKNNISNAYHLILDTFGDLPGIVHTSQDGNTLQQLYPTEMNGYYTSLPESVKQQEARRVFTLQEPIQEKIANLRKGIPAIDYGIHIRTGDKITTGEMKAISLDSYLEATREYQKVSGKSTLNVYIMTDSLKAFNLFKEKADSSWTLYNLRSPIQNPDGHIQSNYNSYSSDLKMAAFHHFLAEIHILKDSSAILCTFSSNIGRFIRLLTDSPIHSLD
jgi:hypothetical protein